MLYYWLQSLRLGWGGQYNYLCEPIDYRVTPHTEEVIFLAYEPRMTIQSSICGTNLYKKTFQSTLFIATSDENNAFLGLPSELSATKPRQDITPTL